MGNIAGGSKENTPTFKSGSFEGRETFPYLDDEAKSFEEAAKKRTFISRVERHMFDDHFVRMLVSSDSKDFKYGGELDFHLTKEEREQANAAGKNLRLNLEANNLGSCSQLKIVARLLEELRVCYPADLSFDNTLKRRLVVAVALDTFLAKERELALVTYRKRNRAAPATPTHTNEICLNAMTSILSSLDYTNDKILRKPMRCLSRILSNYEPLSLFEQWSPPKACPEIKSRIKAVSWKASPSDSNFPADNVRVGVSSSGDDEEEKEEDDDDDKTKDDKKFWRSTKDANNATFDIELDEEIELASIVVEWARNSSFDNHSVLAPREWSLHARLEEKGQEKEIGRFSPSSSPSARPTMTRAETTIQRIAAGGEKVRFLRIRMKGFSVFNMGSERCFGIRSIYWYVSSFFVFFVVDLVNEKVSQQQQQQQQNRYVEKPNVSVFSERDVVLNLQNHLHRSMLSSPDLSLESVRNMMLMYSSTYCSTI